MKGLPSQDLIGACFRIETTWGDDSKPWYVYRRVRRVMSNIVECHRFEVRSAHSVIGGGETYVLQSADVIALTALLKQERLEPSTWGYWWERFVREVGEPWNVE